MAESQNHGFKFEEYVLNNNMKDFVDILKKNTTYTNDWDFPPISIKSFKNETNNPTIEFGSIERIFSNKDSYFLFLIGYKQEGDLKIPNFSDILFIKKKDIKNLKGKLNLEIIKLLDETLKSFIEGKHIEARKWAAKAKKEHNNKTIYDIRFKIDSKKQRRIQCALKLNDLYQITNNQILLKNNYNIPKIDSQERKRNKK